MGSEPQRLDYEELEEGTFEASQHSEHALPEKVGSFLKNARVSQNKKIPAVSRELKIAENYLEALEAGDVESMPERVYTLGFVRTYAAYLGLDAHAVVERFKSETIGFEPATRTYALPESFSPQKGPSRSILTTSVLLFVVLGGGWLVYHFGYDQFSQNQETLTVEEVPAPVLTENTSSQSSPVVSGQAGSFEPHEPPHPILSQEAEDFAKTLPPELAIATSVPVPASVAPMAEAPTPTPSTVSTQPVEIVQPQPQMTSDAAPQTQTPHPVTSKAYDKPTLIFDQDSWIQIRNAQGRVVFRRLFQAGQTYELPTQAGFSLRLGNAGGVRFALENRQSAPLGQTGQILDQVLLDPATIEGYLNRH